MYTHTPIFQVISKGPVSSNHYSTVGKPFVFHGPLTFQHVLLAEALTVLCSRLFFLGCLCRKQLWKKTVSSSRVKAGVFTTQYHSFTSPKVSLLWCNTTHDVYKRPHVLICVTSMNPFISDPVVLFFLPKSMKLWQMNSSVYKIKSQRLPNSQRLWQWG